MLTEGAFTIPEQNLREYQAKLLEQETNKPGLTREVERVPLDTANLTIIDKGDGYIELNDGKNSQVLTRNQARKQFGGQGNFDQAYGEYLSPGQAEQPETADTSDKNDAAYWVDRQQELFRQYGPQKGAEELAKEAALVGNVDVIMHAGEEGLTDGLNPDDPQYWDKRASFLTEKFGPEQGKKQLIAEAALTGNVDVILETAGVDPETNPDTNFESNIEGTM